MILHVEFLAGTDIQEAAKEAKEKAIFFKMAYVKYRFNGIAFSISQKANIEKFCEEYRKGTNTYIIS